MQSASAFNSQFQKNLPSVLLSGYLHAAHEEQHIDSAANNILLQALIQNLSNEQQLQQQQLLNQYYTRLLYLNQGAFAVNNQPPVDYEAFNQNKRIKLSTPPPLPTTKHQVQPPTLNNNIRLPMSIESLNFQHLSKNIPSSSPVSSSSSSLSTSPHLISKAYVNNNNIYSLDEHKLKLNDPRSSIKLHESKLRISTGKETSEDLKSIKTEMNESENVSPLDALLQLANSAFASNRNKNAADNDSNRMNKVINGNSCDNQNQNSLLGN
jgi:hypothetical protein